MKLGWRVTSEEEVESLAVNSVYYSFEGTSASLNRPVKSIVKSASSTSTVIVRLIGSASAQVGALLPPKLRTRLLLMTSLPSVHWITMLRDELPSLLMFSLETPFPSLVKYRIAVVSVDVTKTSSAKYCTLVTNPPEKEQR